MVKRGLLFASVAAALALALLAPTPRAQEVGGGITVTRAKGGSIATKCDDKDWLDKDSAIERRWITVHNSDLPVEIEGTHGVITEWDILRRFDYYARLIVRVREPVAAVEVKFLLFDIWGDHLRTVSFTSVEDIQQGTKQFESRWALSLAADDHLGSSDFSAVKAYRRARGECETYYASIAFVSRVRTADGRVVKADIAPVLEEARKFAPTFREEDLADTEE